MFLEDERLWQRGPLNPLAAYTLLSRNTCLPSPRACECFFHREGMEEMVLKKSSISDLNFTGNLHWRSSETSRNEKLQKDKFLVFTS